MKVACCPRLCFIMNYYLVDNAITTTTSRTAIKAHRVERFTDIEPKELTFRVPKTLAKDTYQVEVRTALATKELRVGKLPKPVTVQ